MGIFDRLFGKHTKVQPRLTEKGRKEVMVRKDGDVVTILVRKRLVDEFANSKFGSELGLPKPAMAVILGTQLAGYSQKQVALFGQRYSEGKVMVKRLKSGCPLVTDPSLDEPCYVIMSNA